MKTTLLVVLTAGIFTNPGTALKTDQESCNVYMDFLNPAIESAFSMSTVVAEQLRDAAQTNSRVSRFAGYIFGYYVTWSWFFLNQLSEAGRGNDGSSDIFIYCDQKRIQQNTKGQWVDTEHDVTIDINSNKLVSACEAGGSAQTAAWTMVSGGTAIIQLCPWYMKYCLKQFEDKNFVYVTPNALLNKVRDLSTRPRPLTLGRPQIEDFRLLDFAILHELTHTPLGGNARDYGYGWAQIRQLSNDYQGRQNADSYAYMGLGTLLIMRAGISIEANGAFAQSNA